MHTLRIPSGNGGHGRSLCCTKKIKTSESETPPEKETYADEDVQIDPQREAEASDRAAPLLEKETATALVVANVAEPGDEQVMKNLDVSSAVPVPETDTHTQAWSDSK